MKSRRVILALSIMVASILSIAGSPYAEKDPLSAGDEEYEAISALIDHYYGDDLSLILIAEKTEPWCVVIHLAELKEKWKNLKNETFDSLIERNRGHSVLEKKFTIGTPYRLLTREDYIGVLGDSLSPDWDNFDKVFPESPGVLIISNEKVQANDSYCVYCGACKITCPEEGALELNRTRIRHTEVRSGAWNKALEKLASTSAVIKEMENSNAENLKKLILKRLPPEDRL